MSNILLQAPFYWHWLVFGMILLILELVFASSGFLLWLGIASVFTGLVVIVIPNLYLGYQFLVFALVAIFSVLLWVKYLKRKPIVSDQPSLNRRHEFYIGRIFILQEPILNQRGSLRVDDTIWKITGVDMPAGTKVQVVSAEGTLLKVERCE